jgi:hypothetical protein
LDDSDDDGPLAGIGKQMKEGVSRHEAQLSQLQDQIAGLEGKFGKNMEDMTKSLGNFGNLKKQFGGAGANRQ